MRREYGLAVPVPVDQFESVRLCWKTACGPDRPALVVDDFPKSACLSAVSGRACAAKDWRWDRFWRVHNLGGCRNLNQFDSVVIPVEASAPDRSQADE